MSGYGATCTYTNIGDRGIVQSSCKPQRTWIPQEDMTYCPFCGNPIKIARTDRKVSTLIDPVNPSAA